MRTGYKVLNQTGNVLDAVVAAIHVMEDNEAFNAGRGSKLNIFGHVEMDASIMDGGTSNVGAVASVSGIRHPVTLARHECQGSSCRSRRCERTAASCNRSAGGEAGCGHHRGWGGKVAKILV